LIVGGGLGPRLRTWARTLRRDIHALYLCARDPRVPWYAKAVAMLVAGYAISPIDLIPDFIPVLGHLDDLILLPLGIMLAIRLIPAAVLAEHRQTAARARLPTDWRVGALFIAIWLLVVALALYGLAGMWGWT
jgi:uncharacterized membrane protein YkvA (DUF1232 family)